MARDKHPALDLPSQQRTDYLCVVASLAGADGHVDEVEISRLREWCQALDLSDSEIGQVLASAATPDKVRLRETIGRLRTSPLRFSIITDLLFIAYADGGYSETEHSEVAAIAGQLDVNATQLAAIEKYVVAVRQAQTAEGVAMVDFKKLGGDVAAGLASAGVPVAAVAISGSVFGLSAAGITSGLAALGLGFGMATGLGVAVSIGVASYFGVRWMYRKLVED